MGIFWSNSQILAGERLWTANGVAIQCGLVLLGSFLTNLAERWTSPVLEFEIVSLATVYVRSRSSFICGFVQSSFLLAEKWKRKCAHVLVDHYSIHLDKCLRLPPQSLVSLS